MISAPTSPHPTQGGCATVLCQPLDVLKTRLMNSKGEYKVNGGCRHHPLPSTDPGAQGGSGEGGSPRAAT